MICVDEAQRHPGSTSRQTPRLADRRGHYDENHEVASVLDVGWFDGGFLDRLGATYHRADIEFHPLAAEQATSKGIEIIGRDFSNLNTLPSSFDVVVAMDVIEHVGDPQTFLASLAKATLPGGMIIVSTGNTAAIPWRLMGGMYWYCGIAEHISFINPHCANALLRNWD